MDSSNLSKSIDGQSIDSKPKSNRFISCFTFPRCSLRREHLIDYHHQHQLNNCNIDIPSSSIHQDKSNTHQPSCSSASNNSNKKCPNLATGKSKSSHKVNSIDSRKKKPSRTLPSSLTSSTSSSSSSSSSDAHPTPAFLLKSAKETSRLKEKNSLAIKTQLSL